MFKGTLTLCLFAAAVDEVNYTEVGINAPRRYRVRFSAQGIDRLTLIEHIRRAP